MRKNLTAPYCRHYIMKSQNVPRQNNTRIQRNRESKVGSGQIDRLGASSVNMIRNKKGELAMNTKEGAAIWKEYFDKLLNTEEPKELIKIGNREVNEVELTIEDVKKE